MTPESAAPQSERVAAFFRKHRTGLVTLVFTDLVDSTRLKQQLGDSRAVALVQQHHAAVREWLSTFAEATEIETAGDSFLMLFARPSDAARFALGLHRRNRQLSEEARVKLEDRIGIHAGEVFVEDQAGVAKLFGSQVDVCGRVVGLAQGGQILMTRFVFDNARAVLRGTEIEGVGGLQWVTHGPYLLKGIEEAVEVCEVGEAGQSPLAAPKTSEKAQRQVRPDEEPVLGWRPAVGQEVPNTPWILEEKLGEGGFGEVWVAQHPKLKERRVFKFCFRADRVRALKRELTLFRLLKENVGQHPNIVQLYEVYLEQPPFYLEEEFVEGKDLRTWCEAQGGIEKVPQEVRLEIIAQAAEALQAAHDAGIIHRDVKPGNILVSGESSDAKPPSVKLTDFGIGQVISAEYLDRVTKAGFTQTMLGSTSTGTGTTMYLAPEIIAGMPATTRSDIYSLGVVLYQLLVSDFAQPVTGDWSADIEDSVLRDDLHHCLAGKPDCRLADAGELAQRLRCHPQRRTRAARNTALARVGAALGLAATVALFWVLAHGYVRPKGERSNRATSATSGVPEKSVAVLPFANFSAERDTEYLSDGLTDEITSALSRIAGMKVTSRNSAFAFKGKNEDVRKIAALLRVRTILEGSVRKEGNQVRVTARLINASDGYHLWSEAYDRSIDRMLAVQEEIARKIATELQGRESAGMVQAKPTDPEAHKLYLQARYCWNNRTESGLKEAIRLFREAINRDPGYAAAHAGLAASYFVMPTSAWVKSSDFYPLARASAKRALELDPASAEAHTVLAQLQSLAGDLKGAEEHYRIAINVNPNYATAHQWYGQYLCSHQRREEALQQLTAAVEIDPLSPVIRVAIPQWYYLGGDYDRAVTEAKTTISAFPGFMLARHVLIEALAAKGAYQEALDATDRALSLSSDPHDDEMAYKIFLLGRLGRESEARLLLEQAHQTVSRRRSIEPLVLMFHLGVRDYESAITALEQMVETGSLEDRDWDKSPLLRELQDNPRFQQLTKLLNNAATRTLEPE